MGIITAERIADLIEEAPGCALMALTMPQERLRADGRLEVARHVYGALYRSNPVDRQQLPLPFS